LQVQVAGTVIEAPTQHGFEAGGGSVIAAITNSVIGTAGGSGVIASAGGAQLNVDTTTVDNSTIAFNAAVSGVTLRVANNSIFNNGINFNIVAGGTVASAGNNRITPAGGSAPNAVLTVQ
jgi:hypothetical protein